jgi:hypothetical protein
LLPTAHSSNKSKKKVAFKVDKERFIDFDDMCQKRYDNNTKRRPGSLCFTFPIHIFQSKGRRQRNKFVLVEFESQFTKKLDEDEHKKSSTVKILKKGKVAVDHISGLGKIVGWTVNCS